MYDPVATASGSVTKRQEMKFKSLIFVILALAASTARSQEPWPQERSEQREEAVTNEDGGRSYLVLPAASPRVGLAKPGAGIGDLQQHSIFLGSGWADPAVRARETRLSKLLSTIHDHAQLDEITAAGFINRFGPAFTLEKLDVTGNRKISDLEIQDMLAGLFANGPLTEPQADSVYMVFL